MKEFRVVKSSSRDYDVKCVNEDCPWRVHAHKGKFKSHWECTIVVDHTCLSAGVEKAHRNLTSAFMANEMYGLVVENMEYEPKQIVRQIALKYKYTISYAKAWRAKQKVFEMRFGTYEASYDNLPRLLPHVMQRNPGSYFDLYSLAVEDGGGARILQRVFFCLGACARAFQFCLPLLCIDGTFLTGKYKGQILTAIGVDGNKQVLPIAFAFVENENTRIGTPCCCRKTRRPPDKWRALGLLAAIEELQRGSGTEPPIWPDVRSRWCIRHMGANFYDHFKNKDLMDMFKRLCHENQQRKFNALWQLLDQLTLKHVEEAGETGGQHSQGQRRGRNSSKPFSNWISDAPKEKWSLLYDADGSRYGIGTTNQAECYNMVLRPCRGLPLVAIVEFIMYGCSKYFVDRYAKASLWVNTPNVIFCCKVTEYMSEKTMKAHNHNVRSMGTMERRYEVACNDRSRRGVRRERVVQECLLRDDGSVVCTCQKPRLLHLPCSHVIAACQETGIRSSSYVSAYFKKETVRVFGHGRCMELEY
ncbi:hypothetical protein U9M48_029683 [Paspalum notatum var. saurae]|uniref:SWIM-type domain-containing protein n=1 Tax=Paspalum notatum var. saurae TaxID=547442 RepID=A0AAQ3U229_PASNO